MKKLTLKLIESNESPKSGDLVRIYDDPESDVFIHYNDEHSHLEKVVKPYGISDDGINVGDLILYGAGDEAEDETGEWDGNSFLSDEDRKVILKPEQFNYQDIIDLNLKDGDEFIMTKLIHSIYNREGKAVISSIPDNDCFLLSQASLAEDWLSPEDDRYDDLYKISAMEHKCNKFMSFIDERINTASGSVTHAAYTIVKHNFQTMFKDYLN